MHSGKDLPTRDPGVDDMLSDPLVKRLMTSDRIRTEEARALFVEVADRIRDQRDRADAETGDAAAPRPGGGGIVYA